MKKTNCILLIMIFSLTILVGCASDSIKKFDDSDNTSLQDKVTNLEDKIYELECDKEDLYYEISTLEDDLLNAECDIDDLYEYIKELEQLLKDNNIEWVKESHGSAKITKEK